MSQNLKVAGATYYGVPSVDIEKSTGGTARFYDCTGTKTITENGTTDVTGYASASVSVPASAVCTGTKDITENGTTSVVGYANVNVNIPTGGGGGIEGVTELYSNDAVSITYTSTSAGTAKSITGITGICTYPFVIVIVENTNNTAGSLKFIRSTTVIGNVSFASGAASVTRYGTQHYYPSSGTLTNVASTSYGIWGYTISTSSGGTLTLRGRCNGSYYTSLTGTYKVRVLGVKL